MANLTANMIETLFEMATLCGIHADDVDALDLGAGLLELLAADLAFEDLTAPGNYMLSEAGVAALDAVLNPPAPATKPRAPKLTVAPTTLKAANAFVREQHRHHPRAQGCKFCLAVYEGERLCGVAIIGRTLAPALHNNGLNAEVTRVATDGTRNACSKILGAARRAWFAMGGHALFTYTLETESGASLKGAGFVDDGRVRPRKRGWDSPKRRREVTACADVAKTRWVARQAASKIGR